MKNINISNNTFNNVSGYAVLASSFLNVTINNNSINNCGAGIYYKSINPKPNSKSQRPNTYKCSGKSYSPTVDKSSQISGNIISIVDTKDSSMKQWPYGIRLYGEVVKSNEKLRKRAITPFKILQYQTIPFQLQEALREFGLTEQRKAILRIIK